MYIKKQFVHIGVIAILSFIIAVPAFARSSRADANSRSAGRSQPKAAPQASQPARSQATSSASRPQQIQRSTPRQSTRQSAPTVSRSSRPSVGNNRSTRSSAPSTSTVSRSSPSSMSRSNRVTSPPSASQPAPPQSTSRRSTNSRTTYSRPVNRTVEVAGTATGARSNVPKTRTASAPAQSSSSRVSRTITPGGVTASAFSGKSNVSNSERGKVTPAGVSRKIERPAADRQKMQSQSSTLPGRTSGTTFAVRGRASNQKTDKTTRLVTPKTDASTSRMKTIEVDRKTEGDRTKRLSTENLSARKNRTSVDSGTSSALRVVDRKTARRSDSVRTDVNRTSGGKTRTLSTEETSNRIQRRQADTSKDGINSTIVSTSELGGRRSGLRSRRSAESAIVINNNNNVIVQGNVSRSNPRPYIASRRLHRDISYVHHRPHWRSHSGFYFSFTWSNYSCGRVAYLPYRYSHSWCYYPVGGYTYYGLSYYYPRYHRRYIYVSLGGYWPSWYRYRRYYWYGCHPYYWYGATVITEPYQDVTYNTYNTYNTYSTYSTDDIAANPVDEPEFESPADLCFARAVELFEAQNYADAVLQLREAVLLSPDDIVLPFTYSQALFANGDYAHAANVLREAMARIPDDELTVYYPRGLYKDESILIEQIEKLKKAAEKEPFDSDYQLLLGYQYMGIGELDKAQQPLIKAAENTVNLTTANKLLELAAKLETEIPENE